MKKISVLITACVLIFLMNACSRKTTPEKEPPKPAVVKTKAPAPKAIALNDAVAKKAVDGRLYYDLEGHRYWKNYKDGKYYKYDKSMQGNPDFKPTKDN